MRILFIYPDRNRSTEKGKRLFRFSFLDFFRRVFAIKLPPYSLLVLAGLTPRDIEVEILDERESDIDFSADVDLVAITVITCNAPRSYEIADRFRKKGKKVIMGAAHATFMKEEALEHADSVLLGEAERAWKDVIGDLRQGTLKREYESPFPDLSEFPLPRWEVLPKRNTYVTFVQDSRGCPNNCRFCSVTKFSGRKTRYRPVDKVVDEVKRFAKRGFVILVDDNIFGNLRYTKRLFDALEPLHIRWGGEVSIDLIFPEIVRKAAKSGCRALFIGFESFCQEALTGMRKSFNRVKEYKEIVNLLHRYGIAVMASMMIGSDQEDKNIFRETLSGLRGIGVDGAIFSILTPLPGTKLYDTLKAENRIFETDWARFDALHATFSPAKMTVEELTAGHKWLWRKFYSPLEVLRRSVRNIVRCPFMLLVNLGYMGAVRKLWF